MKYYPAFLDLHGRFAVVVGGGRVAERKVLTLLACGAQVSVISPKLTRRLSLLNKAGAFQHKKRRWRVKDLTKALLTIAATDDRKVNGEIARRIDSNVRLINVVDDPSRCNIIAPSIVKRGDLILAISTGGKSPALARRVREDLEKFLGKEYGNFLQLLGQVRKQVQERVPSVTRRRSILRKLVASDLLSLLRQGKKAVAMRRVRQLVGLKGLHLSVR